MMKTVMKMVKQKFLTKLIRHKVDFTVDNWWNSAFGRLFELCE